MTDSSDRNPRRQRRIVKRTVTLERDGNGMTPVAVCPRRLSLLPVAECGQCADFVKLCVNPEAGEPFLCCAFDDAPFVHAELRDAEQSRELSGSGTPIIADVMTRLTDAPLAPAGGSDEAESAAPFVVGPDASVGQVAATMAYERVPSVLVVDDTGALVGTVSALDLVRWLACRMGYVVPARPKG